MQKYGPVDQSARSIRARVAHVNQFDKRTEAAEEFTISSIDVDVPANLYTDTLVRPTATLRAEDGSIRAEAGFADVAFEDAADHVQRALQEIDWEAFGQDMEEGMENVDWEELEELIESDISALDLGKSGAEVAAAEEKE